METRLPKVRAYRKGMLDQHGVEIERSPPAGVEALLAKKVGESLSDDNTPERIRKMMQIRNSRGRRRQSRESTESISEMSNKRRGSKERKESAVADAMAVALQSSSLGSLLGASTSSSEAALAVAKPGSRSGSPGAGSAAAAIEEVLSRSGSPVMARVAVAEAGGTSAAAFPAAAKAKDREALAVGGKEASSFRRGSVADESTAAPRGGRAQRRSSTGRGSLADTDADSEPAPRPRRGKARNRSRHRTPTDCDGPPSVPRRLLLALPLIGPWYGAEPSPWESQASKAAAEVEERIPDPDGSLLVHLRFGIVEQGRLSGVWPFGQRAQAIAHIVPRERQFEFMLGTWPEAAARDASKPETSQEGATVAEGEGAGGGTIEGGGTKGTEGSEAKEAPAGRRGSKQSKAAAKATDKAATKEAAKGEVQGEVKGEVKWGAKEGAAAGTSPGSSMYGAPVAAPAATAAVEEAQAAPSTSVATNEGSAALASASALADASPRTTVLASPLRASPRSLREPGATRMRQFDVYRMRTPNKDVAISRMVSALPAVKVRGPFGGPRLRLAHHLSTSANLCSPCRPGGVCGQPRLPWACAAVA